MEQQQELLVLSGLPASGKSTLAKEWIAEDPENRRRINYDELRVELYGPHWCFNPREEQQMKLTADTMVLLWLRTAKSVVIDNTNLSLRTRNHWKQMATDCGADYIEQELDTPIGTCIYRDGLRAGKDRVGRAVIERMALFNGFIDWHEEYPRIYEKDFVICDIDETLASVEHRKRDVEIKDWVAFHEHVDAHKVIAPIAQLLRGLYSLNYYIIIVSGRWIDRGCGIKTEDWLDKNEIPYLHLFMRDGRDFRKDAIIKQEILELLPKERIAWVLDDRDQAVEMWRREGLTCLQVAKGDF